MTTEHPCWRIALSGIMLALSRYRCISTGRRYPVIGVIRQCCCMYINGGWSHESMLVHQTDAVIVGRAPHTSVSCHRQVKFPCNFEGCPLGKGFITCNIEGELHAQHIPSSVNPATNKVRELWSLRPLP